jgi:hypothetical protein
VKNGKPWKMVRNGCFKVGAPGELWVGIFGLILGGDWVTE